MKKNLYSYLWGMLLLSAGTTVGAFPCSQGYVDAGDSTPISANDPADDFMCLDGPEGDANDSETDLNSGSYFGFNDWDFLQKVETPSTTPTADTTDTDIGLTIGDFVYSDIDIVGGSWSINSNTWNSYDDLLIVIKDGKYKPPKDGIYWSAYKVTQNVTSGNWSMPTRNLSHFDVYGRGDGNNGSGGPGGVPEPGTLSLIGAGMIGLAWRRRMLKKAT